MFRAVIVLLVFLPVFCCSPAATSQAVPTFVGIRTFMGTPYVSNLDDLHADFAVLGVPFDEGTWGWPGERYGPRAMRESSQEYGHDLTEGFYCIDGDRTVLKGKRWVDVGDVPVMPTVPSQTSDKITEMLKKIRAKGTFPIVLGGDHSLRSQFCEPSTKELQISIPSTAATTRPLVQAERKTPLRFNWRATSQPSWNTARES